MLKPGLEVAVNLEVAVSMEKEEVEEQKAELDLELCENLESSLLLSRRMRWKRACSNQMETTEGENHIF